MTGGLRVGSTILIDTGSHETFAPPPAGLQPRLSAIQAWRAAQRRAAGHRPIRLLPPTTDVELGLLTSPPSITDVLAWGYRFGPQTCVYTGMFVPRHPPQCFGWLFLNARDGRMLESTEQQVRLTRVSPAPIPTTQLLQAGFVGGIASRFAPSAIEYQAPESVIRWTFDEINCRIDEHWFEPPSDASTPQRPSCPWRHRFSVDTVVSLAGHGDDFEVVVGHQAHRYGEYLRATLADGSTALYTQETDAAWIFVVQRCGASGSGTAITRIDEVTAKRRHVIASHPVASTPATCPNG